MNEREPRIIEPATLSDDAWQRLDDVFLNDYAVDGPFGYSEPIQSADGSEWIAVYFNNIHGDKTITLVWTNEDQITSFSLEPQKRQVGVIKSGGHSGEDLKVSVNFQIQTGIFLPTAEDLAPLEEFLNPKI
jgi:hypothetical protein